MDFKAFYAGRSFDAYEYFGCHLLSAEAGAEGPGGTKRASTEQAEADQAGAVFRVFAPDAERVSLIGDFNDWCETAMERIYDGNFWEITVARAREGDRYKYRIWQWDGSFVDHADPYAFGSELRPANASVIRRIDTHEFSDEAWMASRTDRIGEPLNIYEVHAGSWRRHHHGALFTWTELARDLIPYVKAQGYTHIEFLPVAEHPADASWGYQITGFFAPTSRYGTAADFQAFVDACHREGVGVIVDFVPVHFALDEYGLADFDGTALYEYPSTDVGHSEWGSRNFMHSRGEVRSFLQSNARFWLEEFHVDGLRMDAVANLVYWMGDASRGENADALRFLRVMNTGLKRRYPTAMLIAEDSSPYRGVTKPASEGGLGFDYKWDLGWMHDTLDFFATPARERPEHYHKLTFAMMYRYDERYILPFSHDEVVHGKGTIVGRMNGEYEEQFAQARALAMYMYALPGKKLSFMGNEFGQLREWDEGREQDWEILRFPIHDAFHRFTRDLSRIYEATPALYARDFSRDGFAWIDCASEDRLIYAFGRTDGKATLVALFNFSRVSQRYALTRDSLRELAEAAGAGFHLAPPRGTKAGTRLELVLASDRDIYNGTTEYPDGMEIAMPGSAATIQLAPFSAKYFLLRE